MELKDNYLDFFEEFETYFGAYPSKMPNEFETYDEFIEFFINEWKDVGLDQYFYNTVKNEDGSLNESGKTYKDSLYDIII